MARGSPAHGKDPLHNSLRPVISRTRAVCCVVFLANSGAIGCKKTPCSPSRSGCHRLARVMQRVPLQTRCDIPPTHDCGISFFSDRGSGRNEAGDPDRRRRSHYRRRSGDRGTGKLTAVRALAALLPKMRAVLDCAYACDPAGTSGVCEDCARPRAKSAVALKSHLMPVPVVDLPPGATEDRVVGELDLERALSQGVKAFEPGLLARAVIGADGVFQTVNRLTS